MGMVGSEYSSPYSEDQWTGAHHCTCNSVTAATAHSVTTAVVCVKFVPLAALNACWVSLNACWVSLKVPVSPGYLYEHGPLSVAVDATDDPWQDYSSGIMECSESTTQINHAVVLVGYGEEDGTDYWIVRK